MNLYEFELMNMCVFFNELRE